MYEQILVLDCHVHTLTVLRSLASAGHKITLGVTEEELNRGFVHKSRFAASTWTHPDIIENPEEFNKAFLNYLHTNPQIRCIFPVGENSVRGLTKIRSDIPHGVLIAMPENDVVEACLDKPSAYRIAEICQIPVPGTRIVNTKQELRAAAKELGLPVIAKASDSTTLLLSRKCIFVRTGPELDALVENWPRTRAEFVVQKEIRGVRHNCDIVAENGRLRLFMESEILRTDQPDYAGNSVFDRSIPPTPVLRDYCERLVAELNYTGLALIQFLRDGRTGESYFLEANPRAGSTIGLAVNCGVDLPAASVRAHFGNSLESDGRYPLNRAQNWFHGDLLGLRKARLNREVGSRQSIVWLARAIADFIRADYHTTFVWNDPKPTITLYRNLLMRTLRKESRNPPG